MHANFKQQSTTTFLRSVFFQEKTQLPPVSGFPTAAIQTECQVTIPIMETHPETVPYFILVAWKKNNLQRAWHVKV